MKNILFTGGNGMIGTNFSYGIKPTSKELNICDKESIKKYTNDIYFDSIIHLAATNLRESENNNKKAIDTNINGTLNMLEIAIERNIPFVIVSTGAVFSSDNKNIKFDEKCITCPNSFYGYTKESSEKIALLYKKTILIRTGWLFGGNQKTHYKYVENIINNFITKTEIKASNDFIGSPTYVIDLIKKIEEHLSNERYGIHHIVNSGTASGVEIARELSEIMNVDTSLIIEMNHNDIPNNGGNRSKTEVLDTIYDYNKMRHWKDSLNEYFSLYIKKKGVLIENKKIIKNYKNREKCRLCNNYILNVFFNLEPCAFANSFTKTKTYHELIPLDIAICNNCKHIQLIQIIDPTLLYSNYLYVSSTSNIMINHLKDSVDLFIKEININKNDHILEIGANDGVCVNHLLENGYNIIGIDPAKNIKERNDLPIICDFFSSKILNTFKNKFKLIYSFHCCAHIEDINDVFDSVHKLLDNNGYFIFEVGYFYDVYRNKTFDTIYHEHIDYHTVTSMKSFAEKKKFKLYNVKTNDIQGGAIQFFLCKNTSIKEINIDYYLNKEKEINLHDYDNLSEWKMNIIKNGKDINYILNSLKSYGKKIAGYGASAKSTTFLYQYKIENNVLEYIIDDNIFKHNHFSPGLNIPIKSFNQIDNVDYIIILSWNFSEVIINKIKKYNNNIRIIIPFPEIRII
uniref:RmlD-like substrate binding domain-containing protein n=1 Tax=viral metagenome TaxID=1070528 RepID=A0A6C0D246_9ZZZZ